MTEIWTGPDGLKGPFDSSGSPVGCKSDCEVDPNPGNSPSCCSGSFSTPETCPNSGVPNYSYFSACFRFSCVDMLCNTLFQSRGAQIHMCMRMMNRAGLRFGLVRCRRMRITQLPSALKFAVHWITFVCRKRSDPCSLSVYYFKYRLGISKTLNFSPRIYRPTNHSVLHVNMHVCIFYYDSPLPVLYASLSPTKRHHLVYCRLNSLWPIFMDAFARLHASWLASGIINTNNRYKATKRSVSVNPEAGPPFGIHSSVDTRGYLYRYPFILPGPAPPRTTQSPRE